MNNILIHNTPISPGHMNTIIRNTLRQSNIIADLGAGEPFHKWLAPFKEDIQGFYFCMDIVFNRQLNFVGNIEHLPMKNDCVDAVICWSVLEHTYEPQQCVREIRRVLKTNGTGIFQVPFFYPYHGGNHSSDCYRFSIDALQYMFCSFQTVEIFPQDDYANVLARMFFAFNKQPVPMIMQTILAAIFHGCLALIGKKVHAQKNTSGFFIYAIK